MIKKNNSTENICLFGNIIHANRNSLYSRRCY
nr:MAG TPA: hypothetical protein [Caudoviricetes sp.]